LSRVWRVASRYTLSDEEAETLYGRLPTDVARQQGGPGYQAGRRGARTERTVTEVWTDADFQLWLDNALPETKRNPYGFIPFVVYPNLREPKQFWGVSDF